VNDGSTDNSGNICDLWAKKDKRVKVIHKENGGVSSARNIGLDKSSGEYVAFVDADDEIDTSMYKELLESVEENKADISVCKIKYEILGEIKYCNEVNLKNCKGEYFKDLLLLQDVIKQEDFVVCYGAIWSACRFLFNAKAIKNYRFGQLKMGEDLIFLLNCIKDGTKISFVDKYFYTYVQREGSASHTYNAETVRRKINFWGEFQKYLVGFKNLRNVAAFKFWFYFNLVRDVAMSKDLNFKTLKKDLINNLNTKENYKALTSFDMNKSKKLLYKLCRYKLFVVIKLIYRVFKKTP